MLAVLCNELVVNGNIAELVFHDGDLLAMGGGQDAIEQGSLATAEEAGKDCHGDLVFLSHDWSRLEDLLVGARVTIAWLFTVSAARVLANTALRCSSDAK